MFPDEIDTPMDQSARVRFQRWVQNKKVKQKQTGS